MTVEDFAEVMRDPRISVETESDYLSKKTRRLGYRAILTVGGRWYWYSVSSTEDRVSPVEVASAITSNGRQIERCGTYKDGTGFEATVRSGGHSYMLGHGNNRPAVEMLG